VVLGRDFPWGLETRAGSTRQRVGRAS